MFGGSFKKKTWPEHKGWIRDLQCLKAFKGIKILGHESPAPASGIFTMVSHAKNLEKQHVVNASCVLASLEVFPTDQKIVPTCL